MFEDGSTRSEIDYAAAPKDRGSLGRALGAIGLLEYQFARFVSQSIAAIEAAEAGAIAHLAELTQGQGPH